MAIDKSKVNDYARKLLLSRMRILSSHSFYGLLLSHTRFSLDELCSTAYTDGRKIAFNPDFLEGLTEEQTDFVLMHEILHIVLQHCMRSEDRDAEAFNIACDIVVNSNILKSFDGDLRKISLNTGPLMHRTPLGDEGHLYTAEEVYDMLLDKQKSGSGKGAGNGTKGSNSNQNDSKEQKSSQQSSANQNSNSSQAQNQQSQSNTNGKSGTDSQSAATENKKGYGRGSYYVFDDHSHWEKGEDKELSDAWAKYFEDACKVVSIEDPSNKRGLLPAFAERILKERGKAQTNWREVLCSFVQEEINDYSFNPPDRRFSDSDFMLPDLNEAEDTVKNILFMIDTSGSMSNKMITQAFDEVRGAIEQFGGKLEGYLGFFDGAVIEPKAFSTIDELEIIRPYGGGGTRFDIIFKYVSEEMNDPYPTSIVILTDGYAPFPDEKEAMDIPVLWVINNDKVIPPWGKHTIITQ